MNEYELKRILLDFFFPNRCPVCNKVIGRMDYICGKCSAEFSYNKKEEALCGGRLISVCRYNNKTSSIVIGAKKHRDGSKISFMAYTLVQRITESYDILPDIIVPVPLFHTDKLKKGYSHTEKICGEISEITGIPTVTAVAKTRKTAQQKTLTRNERQTNLKDCFAVTDAAALDGKHILIIDDVTTTGATLSEIYRTIKDCENCECHAIDFVVFART